MKIHKLETILKKWQDDGRKGDFPYNWEDMMNVVKIQWAEGKDFNATRYMELAFEFGFRRGWDEHEKFGNDR